MVETARSGIPYQLRVIYYIYRWFCNVVTYEEKIETIPLLV